MPKLTKWSDRPFTSPDFTVCRWNHKRKQDYRKHCIIDNFKVLWGADSLTPGRDYWTICGANTIDDQSNDGCEISQLSSHGFLTNSQFHGVDKEHKIIKQNRITYPDANWFHGDFVETIHQNQFNPEVVHVDTINMPKLASELARGVIDRVESCTGKVMVVFNVIIKRPVDHDREELFRFLELALRHTTKQWFVFNEIYVYQGAVTAGSGTHLATYTMVYDD